MSDDYLWSGSGPPDPTTQRLEKTLGTLKYQPRPLQLPEATPQPARLGRYLALAAGLAVVGLGLWLALRNPEITTPLPIPNGVGLSVVALSGAPVIGEKTLTQEGHLPKGAWLETDHTSQAKLTLPEIGQVVVAPNSKVRLVALEKDQQRLELNRGEIQAQVVAPPRLFIVDTPSAKAVDLGCAYTLQVDEEGNSLLSVTSGYVSLESHGKESLVPAGASCRTHVGFGPGTPYFSDTSKELQAALESFDFENGGEEALEKIVALAGPKDSLTLWHLLPRVEEAQRAKLFAALAKRSPPPPGVTESDIIRLDPAAVEAWKNDLSAQW